MSVLLVAASLAASAADNVKDWVRQIRMAGPQGTGSAEARRARDKIAAQGPAAIPDLLNGMDTENMVAANWLRSAFDEIVNGAIEKDPGSLPVASLRQFVLDTKRPGQVRRLVLDTLTRLDPSTPDTLIPPLLDDPEFRRDAVSYAISRGDRLVRDSNTREASAVFLNAFDAARDIDQIRLASARLKSLGRDVSIIDHMGFLVDWFLIGPFDGPNFTAFTTKYPPEEEPDKIQLMTAYDGLGGKIRWKRHRTEDELGTVDLIKALGPADDAAAYAYTTIESAAAREIQIRGGADDNLTVWLNGARVFAKDEWQNGTRLDRFIIPVRLRAGRNQLLVKICQGPKYRDPGMSNPWSVQIRLTDSSGKGMTFPVLVGADRESSK